MQGRQAGAMAEQLAQGHALLAGGGELRPPAGHGSVQFELALLYQLQGGDGGEGLGAGEQVEDGVAVPGLRSVLIGGTGPDIDDGLAADLHAQGSTSLLRIVEQFGEGVFQRLEAQVEITLNLQPDTPRSEWRALFQPRPVL